MPSCLQGTVVAKNRPHKADRSIALRAILVALLLAAINLWSIRHLGYGFEDPVSLLGLTGGVAAGSFVLDFLVDDGERKALTTPVRDWLQGFLRRYVLATPTLVILYTVAIIGACTYSSTTLIPPSQGNPVTVTISPLDSDQAEAEINLEPKGEAARQLLVSNPFGRQYKLSASGYLDETIVLFPLVGLTIDIDKDLDPLPTILLRPPLDAVFSLEGGGTAKVYLKSNTGCQLIAKTDPKALKGAFMLGAQRAVPANLPVLWELELRARALEDQNLAKVMHAWRQSVPIKTTADLPSGSQLYVEIRSSVDKLKAIADVVVGDEPFQDVPMSDAPSDAAACH